MPKRYRLDRLAGLDHLPQLVLDAIRHIRKYLAEGSAEVLAGWLAVDGREPSVDVDEA